MTDTPTPGAAAELPITLQELVAHLRQEAQDFQDLVNEGGSSCPEVALGMAAQRRMWAEAVATLTPHAPAQAQLDALREEVARLKGELRVIASKRDLEAGRCDALVGEVARLNSIAPTSRAGAVLGQMKSELDEARLEVARLTKERDEALVQRDVNLAGARRLEAEAQRTRANALEEAAVICETAPDFLQDSTFDGAARAIRALAALKAQPTDVDALMALAHEYAKAYHACELSDSNDDVAAEYNAREALRAKLAARKEPT